MDVRIFLAFFYVVWNHAGGTAMIGAMTRLGILREKLLVKAAGLGGKR